MNKKVQWCLRVSHSKGNTSEHFYKSRKELRYFYKTLKGLLSVEKFKVTNYPEIGKRSYVKTS